MTRLSLTLHESPTGSLIADWSCAAQSIIIEEGKHGRESLAAFIPMTPESALEFYDIAPDKHLVLFGAGVELFSGRIEDRGIAPGGLRITAFGYWRALSDAPYTSLWSSTRYAHWETVTDDEISTRTPEKYAIDKNNRLYIGAVSGETYSTSTVGSLVFKAPHNGRNKIKVISFTYDWIGTGYGADWDFKIISYNEGYASATTELTVSVGTGSGARVITLAGAKDYVEVAFAPNATKTYTGDNGDSYLKLTNVRIATTTTNLVNTTLGTSILAGTRTVTPGSMTGIYVGQGLTIGGTNTERVVVTAVTSTTFTAVFAYAHSNTDTVRAIVVYADEVVKDCISFISALNSSQLSDSTADVTSPGEDLHDVLFEDILPSAVIDSLLPPAWHAGVQEVQRVYFRALGVKALTWYVDNGRLQMNGTADQLFNSAYGLYAEQGGRVQRTSNSGGSSYGSSSQYGITRRRAVRVNTSSQTEAENRRDAWVDEQVAITPRISLTISNLFGAAGADYPLFWLPPRPGDVVVTRKLSYDYGSGINRISQFYISRMVYNIDNNEIELIPGEEIPSLVSQIVQAAQSTAQSGVLS